MDEATRGYIESLIDRGLMQKIAGSVQWVEQETPISSLRDLALGYTIGSLTTFSMGAITFRTGQRVSDEDMDVINKMLKRRLPEIIEKISRELHR